MPRPPISAESTAERTRFVDAGGRLTVAGLQRVGRRRGPAGPAGAAGAAGATGATGPAVDTSTLGTALYEAAADMVAYSAAAVMPDETVGYSTLAEPERIFGLTLETKLAGEQVRVRHAGIVVNPAWAWTPGGPVYALDGGALSQTSDPAVSARLGLALTATSILVRGEPPIFVT